MKYSLVIFFSLIISISLSAKTIQTNDPNKYLKNYKCTENKATFNAVNKSKKYWGGLKFIAYDADGDPIHNFRWSIGLSPGEGSFGSGWNCDWIRPGLYKVRID